MNEIWFDLAIVAALIGVNAMLAGAEMAFISLREGQLRRLSTTGHRGERVAVLARDPNRYLSAVQLGITLAGFLASATAAVSISEPVAELLGPLGPYASPAAIALVTVALSLVSLIFGELVPKRLAMQSAERWSLAAARPILLLIGVTRPLIVILSAVTDLVVRAAGGDPTRRQETVTDQEIADMVDAQSSLTDTQRQIMGGAIEIAGRPLRQVLVARNRVVALDEHVPVEEALRQLRAAGHSRAPVFRGDLDGTIGQVHLRDLIDPDGTVGERASSILPLPETLSVLEALRQLQSSRTELAAVIDEHGGTAGIVTLEDLIEELVGEIYDETDRDLLTVLREEDAMILPGSFPMHDLVDLGIDLPPGDYATIAGLVLDRLGHLPEVGERVSIQGCDIEVIATDRRSIASVRIAGPAPPEQAGATEDRIAHSREPR